MGRINEVQKTVRITYGNNSIELTVEDDGIHISTGSKQIILDSDVRRDSDKPFEHNSLIIKQDLDEHIEEADEKFAEIQEQATETSGKLTEHIVDNDVMFAEVDERFAEVDQDMDKIGNNLENLESTTSSMCDDINNISEDISLVKTDINEVKSDVGNIQTGVNKVKTDVGCIRVDMNGVKIDVREIRVNVKTNSDRISDTNERVDSHMSDNAKDFNEVNDRINQIKNDTKDVSSAKKAYDILAERYRILLNERKKVPQKPVHTPKQRVIKKVGWELILQKAYQELWEEGNRYPSRYEVLQRAYLIEGYDINTAPKLASYDIGGYPVNNVFINSFADC